MPSFSEPALRNEVSSLPSELTRVLALHHFSEDQLIDRATALSQGSDLGPQRVPVALPSAEEILELPAPGTSAHQELSALGEEALARGECALCVLAGGMATRMGSALKALVPAARGKSFLELRLGEQRSLAQRYGAVPPLWLMTSPSTGPDIETALKEHLGSPAERRVHTFPQSVSLRLRKDGSLYRTPEGEVSHYGTGHGDLPEALQKSGLLKDFVERGGKYVLLANIDNLGGGLHPLLIGHHLKSGKAITCEVVQKNDADRGGIPVRRAGRTVILEEFLLPPDFDPTQVRVFNSNTMGFSAVPLLAEAAANTYFQVKKRVLDEEVVQFERLVHETTMILPTEYVRVPRDGLESRFLPVKDPAELASRKAEIEALALARGML